MKIKGKATTTGLLVMGIVIALAALGLVAGNWTQKLTIGGQVNTSGLDASIAFQRADDNEAAGDKDIASCDGETETTKSAIITVENAYPNYSCRVVWTVQNTGQMPIVVGAEPATLVNKNAEGTVNGISLSSDCDDQQLAPAVAGGDGETLKCTTTVSFGKEQGELDQKASFNIEQQINVAQFNKD